MGYAVAWSSDGCQVEQKHPIRRRRKPEKKLSREEQAMNRNAYPDSSGFHPLPKRWVVERSIAWITRWRRLARDPEGLPQSSEVFIKLSASRRMLSLLAPSVSR
jgi:transposase